MVMSSRTEEGIEQILQRLKTTDVTPEFAALSNGVFQENIKGHMFRGYNLKHADGSISEPKWQVNDSFVVIHSNNQNIFQTKDNGPIKISISLPH